MHSCTASLRTYAPWGFKAKSWDGCVISQVVDRRFGARKQVLVNAQYRKFADGSYICIHVE